MVYKIPGFIRHIAGLNLKKDTEEYFRQDFPELFQIFSDEECKSLFRETLGKTKGDLGLNKSFDDTHLRGDLLGVLNQAGGSFDNVSEETKREFRLQYVEDSKIKIKVKDMYNQIYIYDEEIKEKVINEQYTIDELKGLAKDGILTPKNYFLLLKYRNKVIRTGHKKKKIILHCPRKYMTFAIINNFLPKKSKTKEID